ncbi:hypothetical protein, partial [Vibrio cholerae]|uniref:hypothetical protein n=1 Tax=Vibrio cholerae TaxID=666 RepID=UPI001F2CB9EE
MHIPQQQQALHHFEHHQRPSETFSSFELVCLGWAYVVGVEIIVTQCHQKQGFVLLGSSFSFFFFL